MNLTTIIQIANPLLQTVFIVVVGLGYYYSIRIDQENGSGDGRAAHRRGGRPLVTVSEDYANLPNMSLIVQNVGQGPAKDITFEFSDSVESSDGYVLTDLPFFQEGLTSLAPGAKIGCYWDTLDNLLPAIKEGRISSDIQVAVRYRDLNMAPHETNWDINPRLYEGIRRVDYSGMTDLVDTMERKFPDNGLAGGNEGRGT